MSACAICGVLIERSAGAGRPRMYCDEHSYTKRASRKTEITKVCVDCGVEYVGRNNVPPQVRCVGCAYRVNVTRYRHIRRATARVSGAIKAGRLPSPKTLRCMDCGSPATEYDHRDYTQPLTVDPVCHPCNIERGPGYWPAQERMAA